MEYASSLGGRAVPFANKTPAPHRFRQFTAPKVFEVMKKKRENETTMGQLRKRLSIVSQQITIDDNVGSVHRFVTDRLPYMRIVLPHGRFSNMDLIDCFSFVILSLTCLQL